MDTTAKATPAKERKVKGMVEIEISKCKGCELCRTACKENALTLSDTINIITVYRTNPKKGAKKEDITPSNIKEEIKAIITSPVYSDLSNMDYI